MIGQPVFTVAVLSILIAAPFGAIFMDNSYKRLGHNQSTICTGDSVNKGHCIV